MTTPDAALLQTEQIAEFTKARGVAPPERIWLVYEAGGETVWSAEPDPEGNGEPSVGYALERAGQAHVAGLLEALEDQIDGCSMIVRMLSGQESSVAHSLRAMLNAQIDAARAAIAAVKGA